MRTGIDCKGRKWEECVQMFEFLQKPRKSSLFKKPIGCLFTSDHS